jgi:hypothetical protein
MAKAIVEYRLYLIAISPFCRRSDSSQPRRSLYIHCRASRRRVLFQTPVTYDNTRITGMSTRFSWRARSIVMRRVGIRRCSLLTASSTTADGVDWFEILKINRLIQIKRSAEGIRCAVSSSDGEELVVRTVPESAPKTPKRTVGRAKVGKPEAVKR